MTAKREPVKNAGIIRLIDTHIEHRARRGQTVRFKYVKGHSGDVGNDGADAQANLGVLRDIVAERDWQADLEVLMQAQAMWDAEDTGVEVEASPTRKRSRTPPRQNTPPKPASTSIAVGIRPQAPQTPSRGSAARLAAIEHALNTPPKAPQTPSRGSAARLAAIEHALNTPPEKGEPPNKRRGVSPPRPLNNALFPPARAPQTPTSARSARLADVQAALETPSKPSPSSYSRRDVDVLPSLEYGTGSRRGMTTSATSTAPMEAFRCPVKVLYAAPPLIPVRKEDVNFDVSCSMFLDYEMLILLFQEYDGCLLSEDELANEI